ncbi:transcriptional accessory protein [Clostridium sp. CAG:465]|nr:transcriptional accessory protein [Clostridium sp. CAG:465]
MEKIIDELSIELNIEKNKIGNTIKLIDEGNTIPFIARYRKEVTGNLSDEVLRKLNDRLIYLRNLEARKDEVIRLIDEQGKLTEELKNSILNASILTEVEDLYRPYKQKKRTRATIAKERGLEPLAKLIISQTVKDGNKDEIVTKYINKEKGLETVEECINGALDIIAEDISDNAKYRKKIRGITYRTGKLVTTAVNKDESTVYDMYYNFSEEIKKIPSHRILAITRGEKEKVLKVKLDLDEESVLKYLERETLKGDSIFKDDLILCIEDSYKRLIKPSIEREIRGELFEEASEKAIEVFGVNAKNLLMQPPIKNVVVMGFDPAYRTGCKIAIIDDTGKLLDYTTIYPTQPQNDIVGATKSMIELINKYNVNIIALGNGTASRESEKFIAEVIKKIDKKVYYAIVSEAGASVYSASELATKEYPDINVSIRGAISIARRLQDPLAELVKIDPKSIGVGQYQHDVNQKRLDESLTGVVENVVNNVGVDINTATPSLLSYVSGVNKQVATNIVKYREENGKFNSRKEFLKVPKLGKAAFVQCAGFLKVPESKNILDNTMVHPESYEKAEELISSLGFNIKNLTTKNMGEVISKLDNVNIDNISKTLNIGSLTMQDIVTELKKPGRDPRDEMPKIVVKSDVLSIDDITEGMILTGTVRNVVDFGAFVDVGIKNDGLVHISEISDKYVRNPMEEVAVGDIVKVKVIGIDKAKGKVSLSMKGVEK